MNASAYRDFLLRLPDHGVSDGASYGALVAATTASHGAGLVTCDRRAARVYERYGIRVHLLRGRRNGVARQRRLAVLPALHVRGGEEGAGRSYAREAAEEEQAHAGARRS